MNSFFYFFLSISVLDHALATGSALNTSLSNEIYHKKGIPKPNHMRFHCTLYVVRYSQPKGVITLTKGNNSIY